MSPQLSKRLFGFNPHKFSRYFMIDRDHYQATFRLFSLFLGPLLRLSGCSPRRRSRVIAISLVAGDALAGMLCGIHRKVCAPAFFERRRSMADKKQEILAKAAECFMEQGFHATTIDDVARRLGSTKGRIYHHYASKTDLFFDVHREGMDRLFRAIVPALQAPAMASLSCGRCCGHTLWRCSTMRP